MALAEGPREEAFEDHPEEEAGAAETLVAEALAGVECQACNLCRLTICTRPAQPLGHCRGRGADFGPPASVVEVGTFKHPCEGELVCKLTNEGVREVAEKLHGTLPLRLKHGMPAGAPI